MTPLFESEGASRFVAPVGGGFTSRRLPFDPEVLTGVVGDGVAVARGAAELRIHDGAGALIEIWRFGDVERQPVTPRDESEYWEERIASATDPATRCENRTHRSRRARGENVGLRCSDIPSGEAPR